MKKIYIIFLVTFYTGILAAQSLYTPNETLFYEALANKSYEWIDYNVNGSFIYSQPKRISVSGDNTLNIKFSRSSDLESEFRLENLNLSGYENINIWIRHKTQITLRNCTFNFHKNGGITIYFENGEYLYPKTINDTGVLIDSCAFNNDCETTGDKPITQLFLTKDIYPVPNDPDKNYKLNNVKILNTTFKSLNYPNGIHKSIASIHFYRTGPEVSYSNIDISNNTIFNSSIKDAMTDGIVFSNNNAANFRNPALNHYTRNKNITILGNNLNTDSNDPAHAIFVQGPYDSVTISDNKMYNFGANFLSKNGDELLLDGAIHLYGARTGDYCDDVIHSKVINNIVSTVSSGIQLLGSQNSIVKGNSVSVLPFPGYWINNPLSKTKDRLGIRVGTGDYEDDSRQSNNIKITNNIVNCNNEIGVVGIMTDAKNFEINNNKVFNPNNYGIIYWGHRAVSQLDIGNSKIENNIIDFGNQTQSRLKAHFYSKDIYSGMKFAGIHFYRMKNINNETYSNERLIIKNNQIIKDESIEDISIIDFTDNPVKPVY